jgi:uncharacterized GH25 family protein
MKKPRSKAKNGIEQFDDVVQPKSLYRHRDEQKLNKVTVESATPTRTRSSAISQGKSTISPYNYDSESEEPKKEKTKQGIEKQKQTIVYDTESSEGESNKKNYSDDEDDYYSAKERQRGKN